jgi:hypothetical protein
VASYAQLHRVEHSIFVPGLEPIWPATISGRPRPCELLKTRDSSGQISTMWLQMHDQGPTVHHGACRMQLRLSLSNIGSRKAGYPCVSRPRCGGLERTKTMTFSEAQLATKSRLKFDNGLCPSQADFHQQALVTCWKPFQRSACHLGYAPPQTCRAARTLTQPVDSGLVQPQSQPGGNKSDDVVKKKSFKDSHTAH